MPSRTRRVALLLALYFCQGLPYGLQVTALPIYLREAKVSLTAIGFVQFLALPWILKALWAPLVDRFGSAKFGRRKSWIVPLQLAMAATAAAGALLAPSQRLTGLLAVVFAMNLFAATQDIAVDGLAVDLLGGKELGAGNVAQVDGYKLGMMTSGGLLVWVAGTYGWQWLFLGMAALCLVTAVFVWTQEEPPSTAPVERTASGGVPFRVIASRLWSAVKIPGGAWLLVFVGTYKLGESLVDAQYKSFLIDHGFQAAQLGLWLGTYGMVASILGSVAGGLTSMRLGLFRSLVICGVVRAVTVGAEAWLATLSPPTADAVRWVSLAEHFAGGMLTTALFAFMMSRVDPAIGSTHYTLLASIEVLGKSPGAWASGPIAERFGYFPLFAIGTVLSFAFLLLLFAIGRAPPRSK